MAFVCFNLFELDWTEAGQIEFVRIVVKSLHYFSFTLLNTGFPGLILEVGAPALFVRPKDLSAYDVDIILGQNVSSQAF